MNSLLKFVVSTTLKQVGSNNARLIKENIAGEVSKLKQQSSQDVLIYGSSNLVHMLMPRDLRSRDSESQISYKCFCRIKK